MNDMKLIKEKAQKVMNKIQDFFRTGYLFLTEIIDTIKRMIGVMVILIIVASTVHAWSLFDGLYKKVDEIKQQTNNTKVELSAVKNLSAQAVGKIEKLGVNLKANAEVQNNMLAGINNKSQTTSVGRDQKVSTVNESAIFIKYVESQEKLSKVYEKIIIVLIGQLCALLTLFIRKDEKATTALIQLISDDSKREDEIYRKTEVKTTTESVPLSEHEKEILSKKGGKV